MTKGEIKKRLNDVLKMADPNDPLGYLEFEFRAVELYIRKETKQEQFTLKKSPLETNSLVPKYLFDRAVLFFNNASSHMLNRLNLAVGLGLTVNRYLPDSPFSIYNKDDIIENSKIVDSQRILYFAEALLQNCVNSFDLNNAFIKDGNAKEALMIPDFIKTIYKKYDKSQLSPEIKKEIDDLLRNIYSVIKDKGYLFHHMNLVKNEIKTKHGIGYIIRKKTGPNVNEDNAITYKKNSHYTIIYSPYNNPMEQRVLIGHELGNIACHWSADRIYGETENERREATYYAKILLENRMSLHLNGTDKAIIEKMNEDIKNAIYKIYKDKPWVNEIYSPREWR